MISACLALLLASLISLGNIFPLFSLQSSPLMAIPFLSSLFAGSPPTNLGVHNQKLAPCPTTPNCVVSQNGDTIHSINAITYQGTRTAAKETLVKILGVVPRTKIIEQSEDYLRAESSSRLLGFVDDVEFYFPENETVIQVRSSSRLGESDLGVNRRRIEQIRLAFQDLKSSR